MRRKGIGIGSASLVLIFTVLCLSIFAMISYITAMNEMALARAEADHVIAYYEADALAGRITAALTASYFYDGYIPWEIYGVEITLGFDMNLFTQTASFVYEISENRELFVKMALHHDRYDILVWRVRDMGMWIPDLNLPVWLGN